MAEKREGEKLSEMRWCLSELARAMSRDYKVGHCYGMTDKLAAHN